MWDDAFPSFLIGLREGLEAGLIVSILVATLVRSGQSARLGQVWTGVLAAVGLSLSFGAVLTFTADSLSATAQEAFGGTLSIVAVAFVTAMVFWMRRNARNLSGEIRDKVGAALAVGSGMLVLTSFLAVGREGLETALFIWTTAQSAGDTKGPLVGAAVGLVLAGGLCWALYRRVLKINLTRFFSWTGAGLIVIAAGVLGYGLRDLQEGGVLPGAHSFAVDLSGSVDATSWYATLVQGVFNLTTQMTWLQLIAYVAYLATVMTLFIQGLRTPPAASAAAASAAAADAAPGATAPAAAASAADAGSAAGTAAPAAAAATAVGADASAAARGATPAAAVGADATTGTAAKGAVPANAAAVGTAAAASGAGPGTSASVATAPGAASGAATPAAPAVPAASAVPAVPAVPAAETVPASGSAPAAEPVPASATAPAPGTGSASRGGRPRWLVPTAVVAIPAVVAVAVIAAADGKPTATATVSVSPTACGKGFTTPRPGQQSFQMNNTGKSVSEVYLVDPTTNAVYGEIEGLAPGTTRTLTATIGNGSYAWRCVPTGGTAVTSPAVQVTGGGTVKAVLPLAAAELDAPLAAYKAYVDGNLTTLLATSRKLQADLHTGDLTAAKADWLTAHVQYSALGAAYGTFSDFDKKINGRADGLPDGVHDKDFTGFHRLEYGLWHGESAQSLSAVGDALVTDVAGLQKAFPTQDFDPTDLPLRTHEVLENTLQFELTGDTDAGSGTNLATARANLSGTQELLSVLRPLIAKRGPDLLATVDADIARLSGLLQATQQNGVWTPVQQLDPTVRSTINGVTGQLLEDLAPIPDLLEIRKSA